MIEVNNYAKLETLRDSILLAVLDIGEPTARAIQDWCADENSLNRFAISETIPILVRDGYLERFADGSIARYRLPK